MKKVLILAYYFPPMAVSGSMRPTGFCSHLEEYGFDPYVISNAIPKSPSGPIPLDYSLLKLLPPDIKVDRVGHMDWMQVLLDARTTARQLLPDYGANTDAKTAVTDRAEEAVLKRSGMLRRASNRLQDRFLLFPDKQKGWINSVYRHTKGFPSDKRPDVVFATGNPWSALLAGVRVANLFDVPLVSDFRDPWTQNPSPPSPESATSAEKCERLILERSSRVITNTDALKVSFSTLYPKSADKLVTITNGYHESLIDNSVRDFEGIRASSKVELNYFGSVYELRRPTTLLKVLADLTETEGVTSNDIVVRFTGNWGVKDTECNFLANRLEEIGVVIRGRALTHGVYLEQLRRSQHLLVLQQGFPLQIPGKIYEYIAARRPLIVIGGDGATADLVREQRLGLVCANEYELIKDTILGMIRDEIIVDPPAPETITRFGYRSITSELSTVLAEALSTY